MGLEQVVETIKTILASGFTLSDADQHFIESTFGISGPDEIRAYIDSEDSDLDVLLERIISPGESIQFMLEPVLQTAALSSTDGDSVLKSLTQKDQKTTIHFSHSDACIEVVVPYYIMGRFVKKLRMDVNPSMQISRASERVSIENRGGAMVTLRNANLILNDAISSFIERFFSSEQQFSDDFNAIFSFSISILEELKEAQCEVTTTFLRNFFVDRKRQYERILASVIDSEKKRAKGSIEAIMMQGERIPPDSKEGVEKKIRNLELVLENVFFFMDHPTNKTMNVDLGRVSGVDDIEKMFKLMSGR